MGIAQLSRDMLQNWVLHRCACVKLSAVSHYFGELLTFPEIVSRDMGYRSDSIAISRDMGPLRLLRSPRAQPEQKNVKSPLLTNSVDLANVTV